HLQSVWIVGLAKRDQVDAERPCRLDLALGLVVRIDAGSALGAAAPGKLRQRFERLARAAIVVDERAEGARPNVLAANEPQPVDPLLVGETNARACSLHISSRDRVGERMTRFDDR